MSFHLDYRANSTSILFYLLAELAISDLPLTNVIPLSLTFLTLIVTKIL